ncbi:TPA: hypothetical protein ACH3X1_006085 [Trebouxia sp. C0004]
MVEVKKMRQLVRAVQSLSSQSKVGTSPSQASDTGNQRTSRECKHCLNPVVGKPGCNEARARRAMKLLEHMGSRAGCRAQFERCNAELAALARALPHLDIRTRNSSSSWPTTFDTDIPVLVTRLFVNIPGAFRASAAGSSYRNITDEYVGNEWDAARDFHGRRLSIAAYADVKGNHSLQELVAAGTVETLLTEMTSMSYPITFTGTDVNSYRVTDLTGAQFKIADTGVVICNIRVIITDGLLLPAATYYELPFLSTGEYDAYNVWYTTSYSLPPAPAPSLANQAPAQAPAPALPQASKGKLRF